MSYELPITILNSDFTSKIVEAEENAIVAEISRQMGIVIDKDEFKRLLANDRHQYNTGYSDGYKAAQAKFETPKAEWTGVDLVTPFHYVRCSNCEELYSGDMAMNWLHCPNCGARMKTIQEYLDEND